MRDDVNIPPMNEVIQQLQVDIENKKFNAEDDKYKGKNLIEAYIDWKIENGGFDDDIDEQYASKPTIHLGGDGGPQTGEFKKGRHSR